MIRSRILRTIAAALAATVVALVAVAALGFLLAISLMFLVMPKTEWAPILIGALLIIIFGLTFAVSFREMLDKLRPQ